MTQPRLRALFPAGVVTAETDLEGPHSELLPEEGALIASAVPHRRTEFRAGRHCARQALEELLGRFPGPLLRESDRAPRWPAGVAGSITHTGRGRAGFCGAVVASTARFRSLGLDAERDVPLEVALFGRVLVEEELAFLEGLPEAERGRTAKLFFSAKESAYKCQYFLTRQFLEFAAVRITLTGPSTFEAAFTRRVGEFAEGHCLSGAHSRSGGVIVTAVTIAA